MSDQHQVAWGMVPTRAILDPELPDRTLRILAAIATHINRNRVCDPKQETLAREFKVTQQAISKHLRILEERGYLESTRVGFPGRNVYRIIMDQPDIPQSQPPEVVTERDSHNPQRLLQSQPPEVVPVTTAGGSDTTNGEKKEVKNIEKKDLPSVSEWTQINRWRKTDEGVRWLRQHHIDPYTYKTSTVRLAYLEWCEEVGHAIG